LSNPCEIAQTVGSDSKRRILTFTLIRMNVQS